MRNIGWIWLFVLAAEATAADPATLLYHVDFITQEYGRTPPGWRDQRPVRPNPGWIVDGNRLLSTRKRSTGLITYEGYLSTGKPARQLADVRIAAEYTMTPRESFGLVARLQDRQNYYLARVTGDDALELVAVVDGV